MCGTAENCSYFILQENHANFSFIVNNKWRVLSSRKTLIHLSLFCGGVVVVAVHIALWGCQN
jgi:hypothetical protein